jgi:uncharacterized protein (DUF1800 family)
MALSYFAPWQPTDSDPFDRRKAAHLLRRTGFGAGPEEIDRVVEQGLEATVEEMFAEDAAQEDEFQATLQNVAGSLMNLDDPGQVAAWWVHRMVRTRTPLREKLTLFWHGHFATSANKVGDGNLMHAQIETLRQHAWGDFPDLVMAMARDPAMLVWLDGESNTKEHPNENFARELMELFTCGIGNYTEQDVQEAARAFSGWHRDGYNFYFNEEAHDGGRKQFLGKSGRFDGTDIVAILMQQPATPRFIAGKLLRFFAAEPSPEALTEAAAVLDGAQLNIHWFLRDLFLSKYFFSDECYRKRIASPAEYVIGTARTLGLRMPSNELRDYMGNMGQSLLYPPNVKGWDGEQKWINSATWPTRVEFANQIAGLQSDNPFGQNLPLEDRVPLDVTDPQETVRAMNDLLEQGDIAPEVQSDLAEFLVMTDEGPNADYYRDDEGFRRERNRAALAMILSLPEYHAC